LLWTLKGNTATFKGAFPQALVVKRQQITVMTILLNKVFICLL